MNVKRMLSFVLYTRRRFPCCRYTIELLRQKCLDTSVSCTNTPSFGRYELGCELREAFRVDPLLTIFDEPPSSVQRTGDYVWLVTASEHQPPITRFISRSSLC